MKKVFHGPLRFLAKHAPGMLVSLTQKKSVKHPKGTLSRLNQYARGRLLRAKDIEKTSFNIKRNVDVQFDISVVISNFNYVDFVLRAIDSVEKNHLFSGQELTIELIVVDDCSTDGSVEAMKSFLSENSTPTTLIALSKNVGVSKARNIGIGLSTGKYIFILDADNTIKQDTLSKLYTEIKSSEATAAYGTIQKVQISDGKLVGTLSNRPYDFDSIVKKNYIDVMALYEAEKLHQLGGFDEDLLLYGWNREDWELWVHMGKKNAKIAFLEEEIGFYSVKGDSLLDAALMTAKESESYIARKHDIRRV